MFIKAKYGNDEVWLNTDFIVDLFEDKKNGVLKAYTLDDERGEYIVSPAEWRNFLWREGQL